MAALGRATRSLQPSAGFQQRVMLAIEAEQSRTSSRELFHAARRFLPVAALVAALGVMWATLSERSANAAVAVADPASTTELYW